MDLILMRARFEAAGCPLYWAVDPDEQSVTVWQLRGEEYVEVPHVGGERLDLDTPYPVSVLSVALVD